MIEAAETTAFTKGEKLLRLRDVKEKTSFASSTIYRYIETMGFPRPLKFGPATARWRESEVDAWIAGIKPEGSEVTAQ